MKIMKKRILATLLASLLVMGLVGKDMMASFSGTQYWDTEKREVTRCLSYDKHGQCTVSEVERCEERKLVCTHGGGCSPATNWVECPCDSSSGGGGGYTPPSTRYEYSKKPTVSNVTTDSRFVKGTATGGAKIKVKYNGTEVGSTTATGGNYKVDFPSNIVPKVGDKVEVSAEDPDSGNVSYFVVSADPVTVTGFDKKHSSAQTDLTAKDIAKMEETIKTLTKKLATSTEKITTLEKTLVDLKESHSNEISELTKKYNTEIAKLKDKHSKEIQQLEKKLELLKQEKEDLIRETIYLTNLLKEKEGDISNAKTKIAELEKKILELNKELDKLKKEIEKLQAEINKLTSENTSKQQANEKLQKEKKELEDQLDKLKKEVEKVKNDKTKSDKIKNAELDYLKDRLKRIKRKLKNSKNQRVKDLERMFNESQSRYRTNGSYSNSAYDSSSTTSSSTSSNNGSSFNSDLANSKNKDDKLRYPNKLYPKNPPQNETSSNGEKVNRNKGVASAKSKARATVTENVNNSNEPYPIHKRNNLTTNAESEAYSADARQFVTFKTKSGKTFHLIINHDEKDENVQLLTEVSEDDLLNFVEKKEEVKEKPAPRATEPVETKLEEKPKEENRTSAGMYLLIGVLVLGGVGGLYYYKKYKEKEKREEAEFAKEFEDEEEYTLGEGTEEATEEKEKTVEETEVPWKN